MDKSEKNIDSDPLENSNIDHDDGFLDDYDDDDYSPTIIEGTDSASQPEEKDATSSPANSYDDEDDDDYSPTIVEGAQSITSSQKTSQDDKSSNQYEDYDPDDDDDYAPTIMEDIGTSIEKVNVNKYDTYDKDDDDDDDDDDYAPTIMEEAGDPPEKGSTNKYEEYDKDDFAPTIMEGAESPKKGKSVNKYEEIDQDDDDFSATIVEGESEPKDSSKEKSEFKSSASKSARSKSSSSLSISKLLRRTSVKSGSEGGSAAVSDQVSRDEDADKYDIGREIAKGGMGAILSAKDLNLRRDVAMKVLLDGQQVTQNSIFRFVEEAQITGQLEHPSIVPVYEFGLNDDGSVYYTMKLVKGVTLKDIIKDIRKGKQETIKQFPLTRLITIFQKVCDAMAFAHSKGIIHRDLKPENIMVGDFGEVLVMDWGLAKILEETAKKTGVSSVRSEIDTLSDSKKEESSSIENRGSDSSASGHPTSTTSVDFVFDDDPAESMKTMDGAIMGTPNFMAPEQASGQNSKINNLSDIYALGGVLYNILVLRVPISGKSFTEMMVNIVRGNIPEPTTFNQSSRKKNHKNKKIKKDEKETKKINFSHCPGGKIPESLSAVTMKALALKQEDRYQTVQEIQTDIEAFQGGFATSAEEASLAKQMVLFVKRHKAITVIVAISLIASIVQGSYSIRKLTIAKTQAELARDEAEDQKVEAEKQKVEAEKQKDEADLQKNEANEARKRAEIARKEAEVARKNAEKQRIEAEAAKLEAEESLKKFELEKKAKEEEEKAKKLAEKKTLKVTKTSAPEFINKSLELSKELKWKEAIEAIETALNYDHTLGEAWVQKGRLHLGDLEFKDALYAFSKSGNIDSSKLIAITTRYSDLKRKNKDKLGAGDLRNLSKELGREEDFILSDRIYNKALEVDNRILSQFNRTRYELKKTNLDLTDIAFQYSISDEKISLDISNNKELRNIKSIAGLPITHLDLSFTQITDFRHLIGMPIRILHLPAVTFNENVLLGMPLEELHIHGKPQQDLKFIKNFPDAQLHLHLYGFDEPSDFELEFLKYAPIEETHLYLHGDQFDDLNLFIDVAMTKLTLKDTAITDFSPLRYHKLAYLDVSGHNVKNIKPLEDMPLKHLSLEGMPISDKDISVLEGKALEYLSLKNTSVKDIDVLQGMPLEHLNISGTQVIDFSVLKGMPLTELYIEKLPILDIRLLRGSELTSLYMSGTYVNDIRVLSDMPLKELDISNTKVTDIKVLYRKPLNFLSISNTIISDLSILKGMPLKELDISNTPVVDISPIADMNLTYLSLANTDVSDIRPIKGMPVKELSLLGCKKLNDVTLLAECNHLQKLILPDHILGIAFLQKHLTLEYLSDSGDLPSLKQSTTIFWNRFKEKQGK